MLRSADAGSALFLSLILSGQVLAQDPSYTKFGTGADVAAIEVGSDFSSTWTLE